MPTSGHDPASLRALLDRLSAHDAPPTVEELRPLVDVGWDALRQRSAAPDDADLADRAGYDPAFLGVDVPFPTLAGTPTVELRYTHFTVLQHPARRLAAVTAVNVDGARVIDVDRDSDSWRYDPRLPEDQQTGEDVYADNDLDRGHLVRRRAAGWGDTLAEASEANDDTFHFTNAAPQHAEFNQSELLWLGLEDYLLENATAGERRLSVLTGPVRGDGDPEYRGIRIPLEFFKVAAFVDDDGLGATAYLLDQSPQLGDLKGAAAAAEDAGDPPPLGPFRTFQVPVAEIASTTGLDLGPLPAADRMAPVTGQGARTPLRELRDLTW